MIDNHNKKERFSNLSKHKRDKNKLLSPMGQLEMKVFNWERDLLPEHLWIESLAATYPDNIWPKFYNIFLDKLEEVLPENIVIFGFITDFGLIPKEKRDKFVIDNEALIHDVFSKPFARIIAFYSDAPCNWLVLEKHLKEMGPLNPEVEIPKLSKSVLRLMPGKDPYSGHIRSVPLNRLFKHDRLFIKKGLSIADLLPKYPNECTEEEKYCVQSYARSIMNMQYENSDQYKSKIWPQYFWRHNIDLVPCITRTLGFNSDVSLDDKKVEELYELLKKNASIAIDYLDGLAIKYEYDLFSPERDEILLGLFSRISRIYILFALTPPLWARDIAGIILRCLADTVITYGYLASCGTEQEYKDYISYSEGKEKLLMLHLQDTYPGMKSIEGRDSDEIGRSLGEFNAEYLDIDLAGWTKKSARDLAIAAGLEDLYRIVYDPTSADVHGSWISLKNSNLSYCGQALHRFHRIPQYYERALYTKTIDIVQNLYLRCIDIGVKKLVFPKMEMNMEKIVSYIGEKEK